MMTTLRTRLVKGVFLAMLVCGPWQAASAQTVEQRLSLPIPPGAYTGKVGKTPETSIAVMQLRPRAPAGAPNVILVLTDDVGFAAASTFGGPIPTPYLDRLAAQGIRYNKFHVTGVCSPTRAALLTGRNHHNVGTGNLVDLSQGFPGYDGDMPANAATIAQMLTLNGYNTAMFGKHHNTPAWDNSAAGPFEMWPTGLGFEYFFGFVAGEAQQYNTQLYRGISRVPEDRSGDLLDKRLASDAINWIHNQQAADPGKPFFIYLAPGSMHGPHQAPPDWIARFKGQFDQGWDRLREESFARQKKAGIIPPDAVLTPRPSEFPAWYSLSADKKRMHARMMEVAAAVLAYQDAQFGRIVDELTRMGELDNTLIIFIEGDNGASGEGGPEGAVNEYGIMVMNIKEPGKPRVEDIPIMGSAVTNQNYSAAWAWALNTPFQWLKRIPSHLGATRDGLVISWPEHIKPDGKMRSFFSHVTDIAPTILAAANIPTPKTVYGVEQKPFDGKSIIESFESPTWSSDHTTQYFEVAGDIAIYHDGWIANTIPFKFPWQHGQSKNLPKVRGWELYNLNTDFSQSQNLAGQYPAKLRELQNLWETEAERNNVYPIDPWAIPRWAASGQIMFGPPRDQFDYWGAGTSVTSFRAPNLAGQSFVISADVVLAKDGASGAIIGYGGLLGGWSFYLDHGIPTVHEAVSQRPEDNFRIASGNALPSGPVNLRYEFKSDGGVYSGGQMKIFVNDELVAEGRIPRTIVRPVNFPETFDIGQDTGDPVVAYAVEGGIFEGDVRQVHVATGKAAGL